MFDYRAYYDLINPKYITWDFYKNYTTKEPPFGQLGLVVFLRTYSRYIPELNRREKWCETILRATEYSLSLEDKHSTLKRTTIDKRIEAETLFDKLYKMEGFLAGRTYWIGGTKAVEKHNSASFNCSACSINNISSFAEGLYWLLLGAGFGFSIENKYIKQLPKFYLNKVVNHIKLDSHEGLLEHTQIKVIEKDKNVIVTSLTIDDLNRTDKSFNKLFGKKPKKVTIKVGDSKEGWSSAFRSLLTLYTIKSVNLIEIDYSFIRKEGERLKTFGGRSSGYLPLMQHFERVIEVINQNKNLLNTLLGKKLTSVEVLDILNSMGLAVVVSGIRRSSELALGDKTDNNFINAKLNLFTDESKANKRATRVMSNNSVALYSNPGLNYFKQLMQSIKSDGEPGLIIVGNMQKKHPTRGVVNPCLGGDTLVMTREGHYYIKDLVGKTVDIWDGEQWVTVDNFRVTGYNQSVYKITLHNGQTIKATRYHRFLLDNNETVEVKDLQIGDALKEHNQTIEGNHDEKAAYLKGFLIGDGTIEKNTNKPILWLYNTKTSCKVRLIESALEIKDLNSNTNCIKDVHFSPSTEKREVLTGLTARKQELYKWCYQYKKHLPIQDMLNWSTQSKYEFIAGLMDSDGTANDSNKSGFRYQIGSISYQLLIDFQLLLKSLGINSKLQLSKLAGTVNFNDGYGEYKTKPLYRLTISQVDSVKLATLVRFSRLKSFADKPLKDIRKPKYNQIVDITYIGEEDVYCCTVPTNNQFSLSNGIVTLNCGEVLMDATGGTCNLVEGNAFNHLIKTENGFNFNWSSWEKTLTLITRACSRVTLPNLWHERWDYIQKRDRLLGVSITGLMDTYDALKWNDTDLENFFRFSKEIVKKVYSKYHDELNINRPLLATNIKPSGTVSQLPTVSSGIHRSYSPYYQRRIRVSKQDPIALALLNMGIPVSPENGQGDDIWGDKCNTWVFSFVVKTAATMRSIDEPAIEQLERYKSSMRHWTDHNTSITVSVDENEWNLIPEWLYNNYDDVIGISFLPKFDTENSPYPQMPYESINEDKYNELSKELPKLTEENFIELIAKYEKPDDEFDLGSDCDKGSCPIR